jgi:tetratricopeptide (TPR) repeat protein
MGNRAKARSLYEEALRVCVEAGCEGTEYHADILCNLAALSTLEGDPSRSKELYEQALDIQRQRLGEDSEEAEVTRKEILRLSESIQRTIDKESSSGLDSK